MSADSLLVRRYLMRCVTARSFGHAVPDGAHVVFEALVRLEREAERTVGCESGRDADAVSGQRGTTHPAPAALTTDEWMEAFRRCAIIADWPSQMSRPTAVGADGVCWVPDSEKFDVEANARAILDDEKVRTYNENDSWPLRQLLKDTEGDT